MDGLPRLDCARNELVQEHQSQKVLKAATHRSSAYTDEAKDRRHERSGAKDRRTLPADGPSVVELRRVASGVWHQSLESTESLGHVARLDRKDPAGMFF